ncbi:MAG: ribosome assembly RNA-binding protein YhbY [Sutterella wadsworthensis]|nr:ribosome assembly RNA-binding protein YhbY [Sutterella wadsworthensis]
MKEIILARDARLALRSQAHHIDPVVLLGANGLTDAVMHEIDRALTAHELIKVRVPTDDREEREAIYAEVAEKLGAARVQMIGKLLIFWRPADESDRQNADEAARVAILSMQTASVVGKKEPTKTTTKRAPMKASAPAKKPGEKKKKAEPAPRRARPKSKRVTKKAAGARS